jgi:hypothetical protein
MMRMGVFIALPLLCAAGCAGAGSEPVIATRIHLTARPWKPLEIPRERYLNAIEGDCRFTAKHVDAAGAVGALAEAGRASHLLPV